MRHVIYFHQSRAVLRPASQSEQPGLIREFLYSTTRDVLNFSIDKRGKLSRTSSLYLRHEPASYLPSPLYLQPSSSLYLQLIILLPLFTTYHPPPLFTTYHPPPLFTTYHPPPLLTTYSSDCFSFGGALAGHWFDFV